MKITFALLMAATGLQAHADIIENVPPIAYDRAAFEARAKKAFEKDVMGYQAILVKNGQIVGEIAGGKARNAADGVVYMTTKTPANIGSTIKFTGGVTLLQLFESKDPTINPKGLTVDQWLDSPIWPFLPALWQKNMDASIKLIKFRHLLQHKSGFRGLATEDRGPDGDKRMFDYLDKGIKVEDMTRDYENANFSLITYLVPMIAYPFFLDTVNKEAAEKKWTAEGQEIHQRIALAWEAYIKGMVYTRLTPPIDPSCNPTVDYPKENRDWAPDYRSKDDTAKGATRDSRVNNGYCQAQGGWYLSGRELAAFVANFRATTKLVSTATRDKMFDDDKWDERMVWSFTINDDFIKTKFNWRTMPYMGGDHGGAHATVLMLPGDYYAVGIINSDDIGSYGVTARLLRAFKTSIGVAEDPACKGLVATIPQARSQVVALEGIVAAQNNPPGVLTFEMISLAAARKKLAELIATEERLVCNL